MICDTDQVRLQAIRGGRYPHRETGGQEALVAVHDRISLTDRLEEAAHCAVLIISTYEMTSKAIAHLLHVMTQVRLIILRGTVAPGVTRQVMKCADELLGSNVDVAYCPERSVEGHALQEMQVLPQLVGCDQPSGFHKVEELFAFAPSFIHLTPEEAEAAKLLANAYRYAHFALANDFYLTLLEQGLDGRRCSMPPAGLPKDGGVPKSRPCRRPLPAKGFSPIPGRNDAFPR